MSRNASSIVAVKQFQSEADAIREAPEPIGARITVFVLLAFVLSMTAVMVLTRMDRVITSLAGKIVPAEPVSVYQSLDPAIIKTINVREGERVDAGQLLATLDPTFAAADVKQLKQQVASLDAQIARDDAELNGKPLVFHDTGDPDLAEYAQLQKALYDQRLAQYKAQIESFDAKIKQNQATVARLEGDSARYQQREQIAKEIEDMRTTLAQHGTGSLLNKLTSQDARLEMLRTIESGYNSLTETRQTIASLRADRDAFIQQWSTQLSQELVKARVDRDTASANLEKALKKRDLVRLTASEPSYVLTVAKLSVGSVLKEGDALFTLMPANARLEAEIRIASRDVAFIRPGDHCVLKIDAFNFIEHGTAEGVIRWISEGAFTTDDNGQTTEAYYKARCGVDPKGFRNVPQNFRLIPGMTLSADIEVGTRSVAMYIFGGFLRGISESMREAR